MGAEQMTEPTTVVWVVGSGRLENVLPLPTQYKLPNGSVAWGYFTYRGRSYRIARGTWASIIDLFGHRDAVTDPVLIAYAKTLWELSK